MVFKDEWIDGWMKNGKTYIYVRLDKNEIDIKMYTLHLPGQLLSRHGRHCP